ncbi:MAG: EF-Tu/IF-2/RF-3 family GTPase [Armatimonadetes bacterium]|nr:EF-Tu/IF-2/RF-3 family GTPase [Armatimonadota bacterium]
MEEKIGRVTHYFSKLGVAAVQIERGRLRRGDHVHIVGHTTDLEQVVDSMELDHHPIDEAVAGQNIGLKVVDHVREHDDVYKEYI